MDLTALINTYRGPLIGLIASWGVPWGDAIEIAQDSFTDAWLKRESCHGDWKDPEVFGPWLRGVALNRYRNWSRGRWRRRLRMVTLAPADLEFAGAPSDPEPSEQLEALRRAIERLPAKQRQVVLMHYLEETSVNQVAALLSITAKTVEGRLYQARRAPAPTARRFFRLTNWKVAAMSVTLVPEDNLRAALRPHRVDPDTFEAAVRVRLTACSRRKGDAFARSSPALQSAAAFLPLEIITAGQMTGATVKLAPATGVYKLLGYAAFPAISLFVLLGATVFSVAKIQSIRDENASAPVDEAALRASTKQWWHSHWWGALLVFVVTMAMSLIGATWLLFLGYIISFGLLLYILTSFAKVGLGNRLVIGQSCLMGLMFLGQVAGFSGIGGQDIHMVDQGLIVPVFYCGALVVMFVFLVTVSSTIVSAPQGGGRSNKTLVIGGLVAVAALFAVIVVSLTAWYMNPILWPANPPRIKRYVESFDRAPFSTSSWQQWEIVARWTIDSKLDPDLSAPRRLLAAEMAGEPNPYILGSAFRVGLVRADQLSQLKEYEKQRRFLLDDPTHVKETQPITSLEQEDWLIRASVLRNDLTAEQRDYLEKRLHCSLEKMSIDPYVVLKTPLLVTQLLEVIERPVDADQYRTRIHDLLRKFHSTKGGGFQVAGGFKSYSNNDKLQVGDVEATSYAVQLMEIYGIPDDLDLNWVRSFLRPMATVRQSDEKFIVAVTLDRLNRLPSVTHPTWLETMYYERSLLAAVVLVGLCIYATLSSPMPRAVGTKDGASQSESSPGDGSI